MAVSRPCSNVCMRSRQVRATVLPPCSAAATRGASFSSFSMITTALASPRTAAKAWALASGMSTALSS